LIGAEGRVIVTEFMWSGGQVSKRYAFASCGHEKKTLRR